jgi:hypothetical protein
LTSEAAARGESCWNCDRRKAESMGNDGRVLVAVVGVTAAIVLVDCDAKAATEEADDASSCIDVAASRGGARGRNGIAFGVPFAGTEIQIVVSERSSLPSGPDTIPRNEDLTHSRKDMCSPIDTNRKQQNSVH